jgi:hypothetical protein
MVTDPFGITDFQGGGSNQTDPCAGSKSALQVSEHRNHHAWKECDNALITHQARKFPAEMHLNLFGVIGFERAIVRWVKMDQNGHHLTWAALPRTLSLLVSLQLARFPVRLKAQQEVIDITKQFE